MVAPALSLWHDTVDDDLSPRPQLPGDIDVDVAIVGAGFTGLWTAYYLRWRDPTLRVAVIEQEIAGFGASGRNGGWCSALFAGSREHTAKVHGRVAAVALQRAMFDTIDEIGRVALVEGIDCHFAKGGTLSVATLPAHLNRLQRELKEHEGYGFDEDDYRWLDADEAGKQIGTTPNLGALYTPHCAAIHPARLVRGLARAVERHGAHIYEGTRALGVESKKVRTAHGTVNAEYVVWATEAFTATLPGEARSLVPLYSLMIATEPLDDGFWDGAGLSDRPTFTDGRHMLIYGQRTADGRFAFGGRGAPYHFGSKVKPAFDRDERVFGRLRETLQALFPAIADARVTHKWGGAVAVPRDWYSTVGLDRSTGLGWAGGYVGDGVATTNLAGRTLADLVLGLDSELTSLPWVGHRSPRWEPEPFRWLGINAGRALMGSMDRAEARGRNPRLRASLASKLLGDH
ncbi:MAG: dependent oxidoreductase [Actinomycetia bacterium]|nr:dependent oxidoreductase [Actinomycetes bacterium]